MRKLFMKDRPGGAAIIMNVITDNKNRSVADIRYAFNKYNGNLGESDKLHGCLTPKADHNSLYAQNENKIFWNVN